MDDYRFSRSGFKFKFVTKLVEDDGDARAGIQRKVKGSLIIYSGFNNNATAVYDVVGSDRKCAVLVKRTGTTTQNENRCQQKDFQIQLHTCDHTRELADPPSSVPALLTALCAAGMVGRRWAWALRALSAKRTNFGVQTP